MAKAGKLEEAKSFKELRSDLDSMSPKELQALAEAAQAKLAASFMDRCLAMKAKLVKQCEAEGLTLAQVFFEGKSGGPGGKAKALYRDPASGKTWSGRGMKPSWLSGNEEEFKIKD